MGMNTNLKSGMLCDFVNSTNICIQITSTLYRNTIIRNSATHSKFNHKSNVQ